MKSNFQVTRSAGCRGRLAKLVLAHRNANLLSTLFRTGQGNIIDGNEGFASSWLSCMYRIWGKGLSAAEPVNYRRCLLPCPVCLLNYNHLVCALSLQRWNTWPVNDLCQDNLSKYRETEVVLMGCGVLLAVVVITLSSGALNECQLDCARSLPGEKRFQVLPVPLHLIGLSYCILSQRNPPAMALFRTNGPFCRGCWKEVHLSWIVEASLSVLTEDFCLSR